MLKFKFDGRHGSKIVWAGQYKSNFETAHMTQIFCDEFERIGKANNLEIHYELHLGSKGDFVRLCCHKRPYGNKQDYSPEETERLNYVRNTLAQEFEKTFVNPDCEFIGKRSDYLGLIRRYITADFYEEAVAQAERFIDDTYDTAYAVIAQVLSERRG